jgi:type II secretory pathway pseudopilin PulG
MAIIDKPSDYFNTVLYTGNGGTQSITGLDFAPDWVWLKCRNRVEENVVFDVIRGATKKIYPNLTSAESTEVNTLTSFNSDGFSLGSAGLSNSSGDTFASWNWLANGAGSANTDGSISSTVSVNTTSGFSIVSYTGTGSNATIGHGLGVAPAMVIIKNYSTAINWSVNSQPLNASLGDYTRYLTLDATSAVSGPGNTQYQNSAFTSSVFNVGTNATTNGNGNSIIAYCFANVQGFSKSGIYTGNGNADGTFVYTGFKPAFVMLKKTSDTGNWQMFDDKRVGYNPDNDVLRANLTNVECTSCVEIDMLSNGFKLRNTDGDGNTSGGSYIYMAFAENPFVTSTAIPACAR